MRASGSTLVPVLCGGLATAACGVLLDAWPVLPSIAGLAPKIGCIALMVVSLVLPVAAARAAPGCARGRVGHGSPTVAPPVNRRFPEHRPVPDRTVPDHCSVAWARLPGAYGLQAAASTPGTRPTRPIAAAALDGWSPWGFPATGQAGTWAAGPAAPRQVPIGTDLGRRTVRTDTARA